ncbi:Hypothetical predicted protein [Olea europaea subsp. europaea]|uniref:Uncharacterized protein n=1 Tax=Olea europaea subsp. europaea TaxID=158383 RepID=A0A8S0V8Z4_OLEEU|nr:Hypothetical predicted protein [Olea europaea subsp. europaea]
MGGGGMREGFAAQMPPSPMGGMPPMPPFGMLPMGYGDDGMGGGIAAQMPPSPMGGMPPMHHLSGWILKAKLMSKIAVKKIEEANGVVLLTT